MTLARNARSCAPNSAPEPVARILYSVDGGPVRTIVSGRRTVPTGRYVSLKAGMRAMPWESRLGELSAIELLEVATGVHSLLAQPHRLEMTVRGRRDPVVYFPDLEATVEPWVVDRLHRGEPLDVALTAGPVGGATRGTRKLVIEVKRGDDRRNDDPDYLRKLALARRVYAMTGRHFLLATVERDLWNVDRDAVGEIAFDRFVKVTTLDARVAVEALGPIGRARAGELACALGGGPAGFSRLNALHVRRVVSIDVRHGLGPDSRVRSVPDGEALFGLRQ